MTGVLMLGRAGVYDLTAIDQDPVEVSSVKRSAVGRFIVNVRLSGGHLNGTIGCPPSTTPMPQAWSRATT